MLPFIVFGIKKKKLLLLFVTCSSFFLGALRYHHQQKTFAACLATINNEPVDIIATVQAIDVTEQRRSKIRSTLTIEQIKPHLTTQSWTAFDKTIQFYTPKKPGFKVGDRLEVKNVQCKKIKNSSFQNYLIKENIAATLFVNNIECKIIDRPRYSLKRWLFYKKEQLFKNLKTKLPPRAHSFFSSIFLGNKVATKNYKELFARWGLSHYLARSGLHVAIFILLWQLILSFIPLPFMYKQLCLLILGIVYFLFSWSSISFIRAFLIFILYRFCTLFNLQMNFLHLLSLVCFFVLLNNPIQLFFLDFQLSFALTFALALLSQLQSQRKISIM